MSELCSKVVTLILEDDEFSVTKVRLRFVKINTK